MEDITAVMCSVPETAVAASSPQQANYRTAAIAHYLQSKLEQHLKPASTLPDQTPGPLESQTPAVNQRMSAHRLALFRSAQTTTSQL